MNAALTALADWIEEQLGDELASRQVIAETALARIRAMDTPRPAPGTVESARAIRQLAAAEAPEGLECWELAAWYADKLGALGGHALALADAALSPAALGVLGLALADAVTYRDPAGSCTGCEDHPAGLCADHAADLDRTDAYIALAAELGLEADR